MLKAFRDLIFGPNDDPDVMERFLQQLRQYEPNQVRVMYEYYREDLIYIVESLDPRSLLMELKSIDDATKDNYVTMRRCLGPSVYAENLVQDICVGGRDAVLGFWETLCDLQKNRPHPNLLAVLSEITNTTGEEMVKQILLDQHGHQLTPELMDIQRHHKQYLLERTQNLVEHRPPASSLGENSFYISERYVNLVVVSTDHFRQRSQNELIETGEKHEEYLKKTQNDLEHITPNRLFRWCHRSGCVPCMVMVSGVPGVGKTTLMQKFVYDWVNEKHYQRFAFIFFFKFRELNRLDEISLEEMILQQYPYLENQLRNILQDPEKLLFIFDGLDESNHQLDFTSGKLTDKINWRDSLGVIMVSLVKQSLLQGCSVLMTSRPTKLASSDTHIFQRVSEIMGFFPRERRMYFDQFFNNKEFSEKAFHYMKDNGTLYTFCYIPSYCWIICTVLSICFKAHPTNTDQLMSSLPKTVTQLFAIFVANILANHSQEKHDVREVLTAIGWMAEHGVMNHLLVFDERHLRSFSVDTSSKLLSSFMMKSNQPPHVTFSFLHLTLQEFSAALVHYMNYSPEKLQKSLNDAKSHRDGRGEMFLRFLCGLSDATTRSVLKSDLGELSAPASRDVTTWLSQTERPTDHTQLLSMCYHLFETRNKALVSHCLRSHRTLDFSSHHLSPVDCSVLAFTLQCCPQVEELNLRQCNIGDEGLERLAPSLHTVQDLSLSKNNLTDTSCSQLASVIHNNRSLRILNLSYNNLTGPHFSDLMTALSSPTCRIEELM